MKLQSSDNTGVPWMESSFGDEIDINRREEGQRPGGIVTQKTHQARGVADHDKEEKE